MTPVIHQTHQELADLIWLKTGKSPTGIHTQGLLVVASFEGGEVGVWRIERLES